MAGLIHDNGIESSLNRGTFFGCRNAQGTLAGVALIGHTMLLEGRNIETIEILAHRARMFPSAHLILGEQEQIENFWHFYADSGQASRFMTRELLFEQRWPPPICENVPNLRLSTLEDLSLIVPVHAQMAFEKSGVNPLHVDPIGFRLRCARRIEQGRLWVWIEDSELIFKTDIVADTPQVVYLEGIYVNPGKRGQGFGRRCLSQLSRTLLVHTNSIVLLVNVHNDVALKLYQRAGFQCRSNYDTIFLQNSLC
jgi:ribosomal protein S18 acetylase RimI-like enzyme